MSAIAVEQFAQAPAPGFRCYSASNRTGARFIAKVQHILHSPASPDALAEIRKLLGMHAAPVTGFYERHDGFVLYRDTLSDAAGIELLPVEQWQATTEEMRNSFEHFIDDPENDPDRILTGVAVATVPQSGNFFVIPVDGPAAGRIFYADHDGWYESAFADSFDEFLLRVTLEPARLLAEEVGCYTRYRDENTDAQWIPEEYFSDVNTHN